MQYGFLYAIINYIVNNLKWLNLVEYFKLSSHFFIKNASPSDDEKKKAERIAVDVFITLKWIYVFLIVFFKWNFSIMSITLWYLIVTNAYTYFYFHVWDKVSMDPDKFEITRVRRRFMNLMLAVGFSNVSFACLYKYRYYDNFQWSDMTNSFSEALWYSFSNSITASYAPVSACDDMGVRISLIQLFFSFVFLTIILAKSMPATTSTT
ncbi:hypothetical protein ACS5PU_15180 [Pedobacter sp. GSP4]|uniref:hypothetical protein n=1 Tax=Pedobacter sp. GSP4 TaxID=3453716 RepID=UPI003EEC7F4D